MKPVRVLAEGLGIPESTRWRNGRLWLCNWGTGEVLAVTPSGERDIAVRLPEHTLPFSIDWLPDGRLVVVDGPARTLLVHTGTTLETLADLSRFGTTPFNELVVDTRGNIYVNGGPGAVVLIHPDGSVEQVANDLQWPNGMAIIDAGRTLVVADSHAVQLVGFDIADDGTLADRRTWAQLEHAPDGICADADGAIWVASVPGQRCLRVSEGGEVLGEVHVDRGCFGCMLGGEDGRTLFIAAAEWHGMDALNVEGPGHSGRLLAAAEQPAPHAGRP